MKEYKIIALIGKSGSGKDSIANCLVKQYPSRFNKVIGCTSRPPREGEVDGVDYNFLTKEDFIKEIEKMNIIAFARFNGWYYGTNYSELSKDKTNIVILNPATARALMRDNLTNIDLKIFYVQASDKVRLLRQLNREKNPDVKEIVRRFSADEEDFKDIEDIPYIAVNNEEPYELVYNMDKIASETY